MTPNQRRSSAALIGSLALATTLSLCGATANAEPANTRHHTAAAQPATESTQPPLYHRGPVSSPPTVQYTSGRFQYNGVRMRTGASTSTTVKGTAYRGQRWLAPHRIQKTGQNIRCPRGHANFKYSKYWLLVYNPHNRVKGYVNTCFLW